MPPLPIHAIRDEFAECLKGAAPVVVVAPTGSGKSTCLPIWMAEATSGMVLVIEPRRVACRSLAAYVATKMQTNLGQGVGYRIRFADRSTPDTRVLFVTPGVALRMLQQRDKLPFTSVLIDEFHERGCEVDLALAALLQRDEVSSLVITSATIDAEPLAQHVGGVILRAEGRTFPVTTEHLGSDPVPSPSQLEQRVTDAVSHCLKKESTGDMLVFLPGKREIENCTTALGSLARTHNLQLFKVHGTLPIEQIASALEAHKGNRRVFLSTNVAETSLTVPGVTAVIDSGLVKMRLHRAGRSSLVLQPISQASMDQRAGRAGRVAPGRCVRLWSSQHRPAAETPPEITRIELDDILLNAIACGLDPTSALWPTPPPEFAVGAALERLRALSAVNTAGDITTYGKQLLKLPVSVHEARLLVDVPAALRGTVADVVALLQVRGRLFLNTWSLGDGERAQIEQARRELVAGSQDEVYAHLYCLRSGHAGRHQLNRSALAEARQLSTALRSLLDVGPPTDDHASLPSGAELAAFLLKRWGEAGFVLRKRALGKARGAASHQGKSRSEPWGNGQVELMVYPYADWGEESKKWPVAGIILEHQWIGKQGTGVQGIGGMVLPCTYKQLADAGLGEEKVQDAKRERGKIRGSVERIHAGIVLEIVEMALTGDALRQAAAGLIRDNRLLKGAAVMVSDDLHLARLLCEGRESIDAYTDIATFLCGRLEELGVESSEDLTLLEPDDLRPALQRIFSVSEYDLNALRNDFPRQWILNRAVFDCHVDSRKRTVDLIPANKLAKANPPEAWLLPKFQGYSVRYQKASRTVKLR
ncbi:MAG: ATP-dependent helicase HrpB [Rhodothermales bacterium]|jgi:ATP-dependent helicase HrpB